VVTDLALLDFEPESKRMRLVALQPGVTVEEVVDSTGFELLFADDVRELPPPNDEELAGIRKIDPDGTFVS
jgi:acyl CoA:acetate/3-ketoacid CoA transferase beta subunit